jgi:hypothetical protein
MPDTIARNTKTPGNRQFKLGALPELKQAITSRISGVAIEDGFNNPMMASDVWKIFSRSRLAVKAFRLQNEILSCFLITSYYPAARLLLGFQVNNFHAMTARLRHLARLYLLPHFVRLTF